MSEQKTSADVDALLRAVCKIWASHSKADLVLHQSQVDSPSRLKEFCVGLLENPVAHPWNRELSRGCRRKALSVAASLFLFRKAIPAEWSETEMVRKHRSVVVPSCRPTERVPLPGDYLQHVSRITNESFPPGWDRRYKSHCWKSTPSVGSCLQASRSKGGARSLRSDRGSFLRRCLGNEYFEPCTTVKYMVVPTAGKGRGVTIASSDMGVLSPLHKTMYDAMSELPWLLRGEAKTNCFKQFRRKDGEVFVSGDYQDASNGLYVEVADRILDTLQSSSRHVPPTVWNCARAFLRCKIMYPDLEVPLPSEAQLMGNLLCFPLLCLQNYIAFRYLFPASVPVKINGDDIVFRTTKEKYEVWAAFVGRVGLTLSRGKTLVNDVYFSLNSSFFWSRPHKKPRLIPVTRVGVFSRPFEDWSSLSGSFNSLTRGFKDEARLLCEVLFLSHFRRRIRQAGRSVRRGLEIGCSVAALRATGLWRRECWYFDTLTEKQDCLPVSPASTKWKSIPDGWRRVSAHSVSVTGVVRFVAACSCDEDDCSCEKTSYRMKGSARSLNLEPIQEQFWRDVAAETWLVSPTRTDLQQAYISQVRHTGFERRWNEWRRPPSLRGSPFFSRALLMALHKKKRVGPEKALEWSRVKRGPLVWIPLEKPDEGEGLSSDFELVWEYEGIRFEPPAYYFPFDDKYALGHR